MDVLRCTPSYERDGRNKNFSLCKRSKKKIYAKFAAFDIKYMFLYDSLINLGITNTKNRRCFLINNIIET